MKKYRSNTIKNHTLKLTLVIIPLFFLFCSPSSWKPKQPNLLVITIDTLRADHLGCYGYSKTETPNIDRLAQEGAMFSSAFSPVPVTLPSHVSIFTGNYPVYHGVRNNGSFILDSSAITLAEILREDGYRTCAIVSSYTLDSCFGLDQGFDEYDDNFSHQQSGVSLLHNERSADKVTARALEWLEQHKGEKFFLWLHYFDPHADYNPPEPFLTKYQKNPYDGEIAYTDHSLGKVLDKIKELRQLDNTLIVFTADHGEGLGEHKERTHAFFIYDTTLQVPLIFRYPAKFPKKSNINSLVRTIDIMPTIIEALDLTNKPSALKIQGINLLPAIKNDNHGLDLELYCETLYPKLNHHVSPLFGLRTNEWKYIQAPNPELYHVKNDPHEMNNLLTDQPSQASDLKKRLEELTKSLRFASPDQTVPGQDQARVNRIDKEQKEKLQSLGYVWSSNQNQGNINLPDPKDRIELMDLVDKGVSYYAKGQLIEATEIFQKVLHINPDDIFTHFMLGLVYEKKQNKDMAIQKYQETLNLDPGYLDAHKQLGILYTEKGKIDRAESEFKEALRLNPNNKETHNFLGGLYTLKDLFEDAEHEIRQALASDPNFADAHYNLGLLYSRKKSFEQAIDEFRTAGRLKPGYINIHKDLGDLYLMTGKPDLAVEELQKAVQQQPDLAITRIHLGIAYYSQSKPQLAELELQKALTLEPDNPEIYFHLGVTYGQENQTTKAFESYQKALKIKPAYPEVYMNLGTIYFFQQNMDQAIASYQKAVELAPDYGQAHFNLATAYDTKGMLEQAILEYQETLRLQPDFTQAALLLERARQNQMMGTGK